MSELSIVTHSKVLGRVLNAVFAVFCLILIAIVIVILPSPSNLDPLDSLRVPDLA